MYINLNVSLIDGYLQVVHVRLKPQESESQPQVLNMFSFDLLFSEETEKHSLHTQIHTQSYCATLCTFPHLTLSRGVWKTGPCKPTGHVDYHFNGLAR